MTLKLNDSYLKSFISEKEYGYMQPLVTAADKALREKSGAGKDFLGWLSLPSEYDKAEFAKIKESAEKIRHNCDVFVVIGIGGSYLGSRAVIEFLNSPMHNLLGKKPQIYFSGNNISASSLDELLLLCRDKDVCINMISKSGTTTEPAIAFRILRDMLIEKYGREGARERIFVTTDKSRGTLKHFADEENYTTFVVPDDVGGRFSVLSAVGLLPIAAAGIDIDKLMAGADAARVAYSGSDICDNDSYKYAVIRNILLRKGKATEILVGYEPYELMFCEWFKQLFGESEGKDGKGLYPSSVIFSTDLHSLGQFIQDGMRNMFETVLYVKDKSEREVPGDENNIDGLNFLTGMKLTAINKLAMEGTILAHLDGGVPNIVLEVEGRDEFSLGYLIYFFELACAMSGYLLGVNPFDQPGVEAYKKNMFALLGKPGYEAQKDALLARLNG